MPKYVCVNIACRLVPCDVELGGCGCACRDVEERVLRFMEEVVLPPPLPPPPSPPPPLPPPPAPSAATSAPHSDPVPPPPPAPSTTTPVVAVFSHHAAIRCFLRAVAEASPRALTPKLSVANTGITELRYDAQAEGRKGGWSVVRVNDAAHLEAPAL